MTRISRSDRPKHSLNDVTAGRIPIMFEGLAGLAPGLQSGGLNPLGIATVRRLPNLPDLPTIDESVSGVVSIGWTVLMAPAGTPDRIIQKVNADLRTVLADPELQKRFHVLGTYTRDLTPEQTGEFMRSEKNNCGGRSSGRLRRRIRSQRANDLGGAPLPSTVGFHPRSTPTR